MEEKKKRFSVIIPVHNVEDYLEKCLDSVLNQSFHDFEVIVIDDVSTDSSRDIARRYAEKYSSVIKLIEHKVNTRQGGARNTGIEAANAQYLMFMDSDDFLKPNALERIDAVLRETDADIVEFGFDNVREDGSLIYKEQNVRKKMFEDRAIPAILASIVAPWNKAYRAEIFNDKQIRYPNHHYYEDYWTTPKIFMEPRKIQYIDDSLYCYRHRATSTMHDVNIDKVNDIMLGTDELVRYYRENGCDQALWPALEFMAVDHILYSTIVRVNGIDWRSDMQSKLRDYIMTNFPDYKNNPYLFLFDKKTAWLIDLIERKKFGQLYLRYHCRNRLTGMIKRMIFLR